MATITDNAVTSTPQAAADTYGNGEIIEVTVTFDEAVDVTGTPQLPMNLGQSPTDNPDWMDYDRGTGTTELVFVWTVSPTDLDTNGLFLHGPNTNGDPDSLRLNGGTIYDAGTQDNADLELAVRGTQPGHRVDGSLTPPSAPSFADDTGDSQSWIVGTAIDEITVPEAAGTPAPTYAVVGSLPGGIDFDPATRIISGTPTTSESGTITIRATNSEGTATWTVAYVIAGVGGALSVVTLIDRDDTAFSYLRAGHFLAPTWTGTAATNYPASHVALDQAPRVEWRSDDRSAVTLTAMFAPTATIHGIVLLNCNADVEVVGSGQTITVTEDPLDGYGKGLLLFEPQDIDDFELTFAANADTLDGEDFYRLGTVIALGSTLTTLDRSPNRPSPEDWEVDQEDNPEEPQRLLPPETTIEWEFQPQSVDDMDRLGALVFRRSLVENVLWVIPGGSVVLSRLADLVEVNDFATNLGRWRTRWRLL